MSFLEWFFLMGTCFRITRLITTDDLTDFFRNAVERRVGSQSKWFTLVECNWCAGTYVTAAVFTFHYFFPIPIYLLAAITAAAALGFIGNYDD